MSHPIDNADRLLELAGAVCNRTASHDDLHELDSLLRTNPIAQNNYLEYCWIHAAVRLQLRAQCAAQRAHRQILTESAVAAPNHSTSADTQAVSAGVSGLPSLAIHGPAGFFSSGWPVAYLIASVIFGIGLLIGAIVHVSQPQEYVGPPGSLQTHNLESPIPNRCFLVARITGMVDCVWEGSQFRIPGSGDGTKDSPLSTLHSPLIHLGDRIALKSGLLEMTYSTGAKVILQGPVTYDVESPASGYLAVGKLIAKLEKKSEVRGQRSESANQKSEIGNLAFAVRTPTATVTDLGTEFGVEVAPEKGTRVCVFQGKVSLRTTVAAASQEILLHGGQSSQVDGQGRLVQHADVETTRLAESLVRHMPNKGLPKSVSLTDLVAGGNGFGDRWFWGINAQDGSVMSEPGIGRRFTSTRKYQRYSGYPQIDGVFIPDGSRGPVQLDSAGHTFALPKTCGEGCEWSIWAYKGEPWSEPTRAKPVTGRDAAQKPMLLLHANAGVTFDLAAIRDSARGCNATRFRSVVRNCQWNLAATTVLTTDVWVFVDGQLRFSRTKLGKEDRPIDIDVTLGPNDRFLTLVSTDGGDDIKYDNPCFLDPRIVLEAAR